MSLNLAGLQLAVMDHARRLGRFATVLDHEPTAAPGQRGVTVAYWLGPVEPIRASGLNSTSARVEFAARLYRNMFAEPQSDLEIIGALDTLMAAYSGDFTLGGLVRSIDLLGAYGAPLGATPGYATVGTTLFRVVDVVLPLIVNDLWTQAP